MTVKRDRKRLYALTEAEIDFLLEDEVRVQAEKLYREGRIVEPGIEDATLFATIDRPGGVSIGIEVNVEDQDIYTGCTCGERGRICAHVGALLLTWVRDPHVFEGYDPDGAPQAEGGVSLVPDLANEFREILPEYTLPDLRDIAMRCGIEVQGTRKDPVVEQLAVELCDPAAIDARIAALDQVGLEILTYMNLVLGAGYGLTSENLIGALSKPHAQVPRAALHRQIESLVQHALILKFEDEGLTYYMLPQAVRNALPPQPGFIPVYPESQVSQLEVREQPVMTAIHTLYQVWDYIVRRQPRRESVRARLPAEDEWPNFIDWDNVPEEVDQIVQQRRIPYYLHNVSVTVPTPRYRFRSVDREALTGKTGCTSEELEFYYMLLDSFGAISAAPGQPIALKSRAFERLLSLPPTTQMRAIIYAWTHVVDWSEMDAMRRTSDDITVRRSLSYAEFTQHSLYREWRGARRAVLRFLSTVEEGRWISIEGLLKTIYQIHPNLLHAHSDPAVWWLRSEKNKKQFGTTLEDWLDSVGRFILVTLRGPLYWLGAIDIGCLGSEPVALRVTPVGSFALQRRPSIVERELRTVPDGAVELDDDLGVRVVPNQVPAQLHDLLHMIGRLEETTPSQFRYRLTAEGVLRALEQGQTVDSVIETLAHWCGRTPPPAWRDQLSRWSENYGKLHIYDDITLIEMADDYALQELLSNTSLRDHLIHTFSPRLAAIHPGAVDDLIQEMERRGYTPHVE